MDQLFVVVATSCNRNGTIPIFVGSLKKCTEFCEQEAFGIKQENESYEEYQIDQKNYIKLTKPLEQQLCCKKGCTSNCSLTIVEVFDGKIADAISEIYVF